MGLKNKVKDLKAKAKRELLGRKIKKQISTHQTQIVRCREGNAILAKQIRGRMDQAMDQIDKKKFMMARRYLTDTDKDTKQMTRNVLEIYKRTQKVTKLADKANEIGFVLNSGAGGGTVNF
ncbi:MAG: hypothetical protein AAF501_08540 [Pseudomonadota bacterium]